MTLRQIVRRARCFALGRTHPPSTVLGSVYCGVRSRGEAGAAAGVGTTNRSETDKFQKTLYGGTEESDHGVVDRLEAMAKAKNLPMATLALAWMLSKTVVTSPIVGASKMHHLEDAVRALSTYARGGSDAGGGLRAASGAWLQLGGATSVTGLLFRDWKLDLDTRIRIRMGCDRSFCPGWFGVR